MKKLILTGCAAALFCIGTMAQVQDTSSINNNLRQGVEQTEERTQEDVNRTGNEIKQDAESTGDQIQQSADSAGKEIQQGPERTGNEIQQGGERANDNINQNSPSTNESQDQAPAPMGSENSVGATDAPQHEIEVLEEKEGPNNSVIYKYQGGLYYVDKAEGKFVKIEESQLKDAEHKAIVSDNKSEKQ